MTLRGGGFHEHMFSQQPNHAQTQRLERSRDPRAGRGRASVARLPWLAGLAALAWACFGDVSIEQQGTTAGPDAGPMTDVAPLEPPCIPGGMRCNGAWVERCFPSGSQDPPRWTQVRNCVAASLCLDSGECQPPACEPGEVRCSGAVPQRCRADLTGWDDLEACTSAAHCSLDESKCSAGGAPCCLEVPCAPDELRCNGSDIQRCRPDQTDLDLVESCATPALCDASLTACAGDAGVCACQAPACAVDETRCEGTTLQRCNRDQTAFEFVEECATAALCEQGRVRAPLSCEPPACAPGSFACTSEGVLQACNTDQTALDFVQACPGGAAFCNAGQGVCTDTPCDPGDRACGGADILVCREDQTGFIPSGERCATPQLCSDDGQGAANCQQPACPANDVRCAGSQLQRCNDGRTDYTNVGPACLRADLCSAQRQRCDFCVPSRRECTPDNTSSRTCAADGNSFGQVTFCPLGCIPATGACNTCTVGTYSCQNGQLSRCNDGFSFTPLNRGSDCSGGSRVSCNGNTPQTTPCGALGCNTTRNACNDCSGQTRVCDGTENFRTCQPDGTFGQSTPCQDGLLCTGAGQCVCTPNVASCDDTGQLLVCDEAGDAIVDGTQCSGPGGNVLRTCSVDGQVVTNTCASAELCQAATGSECPTCSGTESTCSAQTGQPLDCVDGQLVSRGPCAAGFTCEGAGVCLCQEGDLRCDGEVLTTCNLDRTAFDLASVCDGATLRICIDGTPVVVDCEDETSCENADDGVCG